MRNIKSLQLSMVIAAFLATSMTGIAQVNQAAPSAETSKKGKGGGGGKGKAPVPPPRPDAYAGFTSIFDGRTLNGWDGDPLFWRVEGGMIIADSLPDKVITANTFLIWRGGTLKDFELKADVRFPAAVGNTGIQVRSSLLKEGRNGGPPEHVWRVGGYQIEMPNQGGPGAGRIYGEGMGGDIALQGQVIRRSPDGSTLIGTLGENLPSAFRGPGEWNSYHIIAAGNKISAFVNGRMIVALVDESLNPSRGYALDGLLALQMHTGAPFRIEFRNIYLKKL